MKIAILAGVIVLALVGGFFAWRAVGGGGLSAADAAKVTAPVSLPKGGSATSLIPPTAPSAAPKLPSQSGGPSLIPPTSR